MNRSPASTIRKAVLLAGACTMLLVLLLRFQSYHNIIGQAERLTLNSLENSAWSIAQLINGDDHQQLQESYLKEDDITASGQVGLYERLHKKLASAQQELGIETPVYTYTKVKGSEEFSFIVTSSEEPYFRHPFTSAPSEQLNSYGYSKSLPVYSDKHGSWLSAFTPIRNSAGEVVAMVQVDRCFDRFIQEAEKEAFAGLWWNFLLIICLVIMVWKYVTNMITIEEKDKIELRKTIAAKVEISKRLKLREEELEKQKNLLVNKNQYLEDFANIASHDLKSPLRGISNFAGLLSRRLGPNVESSTTEYITFIKSNATRALKLVDGILGYSKLGMEEQNNVSCSMQEVANHALENLHSVIQEREASVQIHGSLPDAVCDPVIVTQLFQNLIGNGLKYNQSAIPTVDVTCTVDEQQRTVIAIKDNGIGIPEEYQKSVFEMFKRLHSGADEYEGSGIGLAFCLRIINSYGGEIWLESKDGEGSTFYFTLPGAFASSPVLATA